MLSQYLKKVNNWLIRNKKEGILILIILGVGAGSFILGRLSVGESPKTPIIPAQTQPIISITHPSINSSAPATAGAYVASKSGSLYYTPNCSGVNRIKEENKVWFQTKEEAVTKGYKAAVCK